MSNKTIKALMVSILTWGLVASILYLLWPDLSIANCYSLALFAAGIVGLFYMKEK